MISFRQYLKTTETISFVKGDTPPISLNGIPFKKVSPSNWELYTASIKEPVFDNPDQMQMGSGCIVKESDGRIWVVHPTNAFGGYKATFPKGRLEKNISPQANAVKETWEESGLLVKITGWCVDVTRTTSVARYYFAKRISGDPTAFGWETEKVSLVSPRDINKIIHHPSDAPILRKIK